MSNINLLPQDIKQGYQQKKKNGQVLKTLIRTLFLLAFAIVISGVSWFFLQNSLQTADSAVAEQEKSISEFGSLEEKSKNIAEKLYSIKLISNNTNSWSPIIEEVQEVMPAGTYLSEISMSADSKIRGKISGFAKTKDSVATLRNTLEDSEYFRYVDIENIATEEDPSTGVEQESFTLSFSLAEGALDE